MKILIVDGRDKPGNKLKNIFKRHSVTSVENEKELLLFISDNVYDVIIFNWDFDFEDGLRVGRSVRRFCNTPSLMLSSSNDTSSVVKALDLGFDDYLSKPFSSREIFLRVKKLRERRNKIHFEGTKIFLNDICVDLKMNVATKNGKVIGLTKSEFLILRSLAIKKGTLVPRECLIRSAMDEKLINRLLNTHVLNLRKKLAGEVEIVTITGKGYQIR